MKRRPTTLFILSIFLVWNVMTYWFIAYRPQAKPAEKEAPSHFEQHVDSLEEEILEQQATNKKLLQRLRGYLQQIPPADQQKELPADSAGRVDQANGPKRDDIQTGIKIPSQHINPQNVTLPILVIACNRPTISRCLDQLLNYRPAGLEDRFPIVVSQDCGHKVTAETIRSYGPKVTHIEHPDLSDVPLRPNQKKFQGYYKIARHYKWALNQIFNVFNYHAVIIVEDDLNISEDFFEYFAATFPILHKDPSLWCVSAWNDNGKGDLISDEADLLYRTDFFPGLGWMMERQTWRDLQSKWPETFWDDWMRHPDQRKDRACIRPEISRTSTFGKVGVSKGQFFEKYLKFIKLNEQYVPFTQMDLTYLLKENYDEKFAQTVYSSPLLTAAEVRANVKPEDKVVRVQYKGKKDYKPIAKELGIMDDVKSGVPRAGYRGIVSFFRNGRRIYFAPPTPWTGYDPSWS